jgi:serine/threonine protein kinase
MCFFPILQAIDFLDKLLRYDHQDRLTAREAMVSLPVLFMTIDIIWKLSISLVAQCAT